MANSGPADSGQERRVVLFDEANAVQRLMRQTGRIRAVAWLFARLLHRLDLPVMRRTGGRWSVTAALTGLPMVELTTTGARTGRPRTMPIIGTPDEDRLVMVASNYGSARNPGWYFNLKAHPRCTVVVRGQRYEMEAYEAKAPGARAPLGPGLLCLSGPPALRAADRLVAVSQSWLLQPVQP